MTCRRNPEPTLNYAAWCERLSRESARTGATIRYGDGTFSAWRDGMTPAQYVATLTKRNPWSEDDVAREAIVDEMSRTIWRIVAAGADPARRFAAPPPAAHRAALALAAAIEGLNDETLQEMQSRHDGSIGNALAVDATRGAGARRRRGGLSPDGVVVPAMEVHGTPDHRLAWTIAHNGRELAHGDAPLPASGSGYLQGLAQNPSDDADAAIDKYEEFHRYPPRHVDELEIAIPARVRRLGPAKHVLYRSAKVDPETLKKPRRPVDYIHEHDAGVIAYACDGQADTDVPDAIREVTALTVLGKCLGFALRDGAEAEGTEPLPDLCCTPDGKCLLVVQDRNAVLAMMWGGALGVFARGIDG